jgi:hypothetical protein
VHILPFLVIAGTWAAVVWALGAPVEVIVFQGVFAGLFAGLGALAHEAIRAWRDGRTMKDGDEPGLIGLRHGHCRRRLDAYRGAGGVGLGSKPPAPRDEANGSTRP